MRDKFYWVKENTFEKITLIFIGIQGVCWLSFICLDFFAKNYRYISSYLKIFSIGLCFLFSCIPFQSHSERTEEKNIRLAMGFTLCADVFLLFRVIFPYDLNDSIGISLFCFAQYFHLKCFQGNWEMWRRFLCFLPFLWILFLSLRCIPASVLLVGETIIYGTLITVNFFTVIKQYRADRHHTVKRIRLAGIVLFLACDVCVLFYQLIFRFYNESSFTSVIYLSWVFYLPSQVLLVMGALLFSKNKYEKRKIVQTNSRWFSERKGREKK